MIYGNVEEMLQTINQAREDEKLAPLVAAEERAIEICLMQIKQGMTCLGQVVGRVFGCQADEAEDGGQSFGGLLVGFRPNCEGDTPHPFVQAMDPHGEW